MAGCVAGAPLRSPPMRKDATGRSGPSWVHRFGHRCCPSRLQAQVTVLPPLDPANSPQILVLLGRNKKLSMYFGTLEQA